jgi:hypothetical protein
MGTELSVYNVTFITIGPVEEGATRSTRTIVIHSTSGDVEINVYADQEENLKFSL